MKQNLLFNRANAFGMRLSMVLTMLLIVGIGQAWAGEATLDFDNTSKRTVFNENQQVWVESGITFTVNKSNSSTKVNNSTSIDPIRIYGGASATIECTHGNITKIEVTCSSSDYADVFKTSVGNEATASGSVVTIIPTASSTTYSIASFTAQTRVNSITVTYQDAATAFTITAVSNSESYGTVSLTSTTITATPKTGYRVSTSNPYEVTEGTATVVDNGNNTFTVTPESDCTVQINFEEKEKNIYIDNVQGNSEQALYDSHKTPTLTDQTPATTGTCEELHWHFMGWVTEANKENPTDAHIVKANTSVTANGTTYYAVWAIGTTTGGGSTSKQYSFDITPSDFNNTSYAANNNEKTSTAKASDGSTLSVKWTSNQVMLQSSAMQWQKNTGYIYNSTDLGTINSITVTKSAGTFTTYYGTSKQPSSSTTVGNGYFQIKVGSATGQTSKVTITFTKTTQGAQTTTYSDYTTECSTETLVSLHPNGGTPDEVKTYTTEETSYTLPECPFTRTGYTFANWNTEENGTGISYNTGATIDLDGTDVNLYAQWTCETPVFDIKIKDDNPVVFLGESIELTVVGSKIAADANYQWYKKNGESYNELTGKTTNKLTIANATANDAGNYKCVVTNGTCSGENNYTVKMYRLRGLKDDTWNIDYVFEKTNDNKGVYSLELNGATPYEFKIHDGSAYYGNTGDDPTMTSGNCTNWEMEENMGKNVELQTTITGTYTFTLDYQNKESQPLISVTYPSKQTIYFKPATSGTWADDAKFTIYSWGSGDPSYTPLQDKDCGGIYSAEISTTHTSLLFIKASTYKENFENITAQTIDLTAPTGDKVLYDMASTTITHLYLKPNEWSVANAWFATYLCNGSEAASWHKMTILKDEDNNKEDIYSVEIGSDKLVPSKNKNIIFVRKNPSNTGLNWNDVWNQTADLNMPTNGNNFFSLNDGDWSNGTWSTIYDNSKWTTYTPNYTVTFDANGHGTAPEDQCITDGGKVTQPTAPTATGYTFGGWYKEAGCTNAWNFANDVVTSDITLYAKWTANTNTAYTVEHYQQNILDDNYTLYETENLTGTTATSVTPAVKDYTGFTAPSTQTVTIAADGSTVVEYRYTRNSYTLTWNLAGGDITEVGTTAGSVKFGAPLTAPTVTKSGLTFIGWNPEVPSTMPAEYVTYTAIWENCIWVETTTIEDGDEIVFIMVDNPTSTSYAMDNKVTPSSNPLAIEINTDIFSSGTVPNNIIWDIQKDANGIVFYSKTAADNYLRCNAKPNVRVGVGANNTFTLDNGYIQSLSYDDSYLAVATGATTKYWRQYGYSSNIITNQTLKFYKRECLDASKVWVEGNLTNVTCTQQLPQIIAKDGGSITLTFTAVEGYALPTSVSVEMGSTPLAPLWNRTTGELTINAPTGGFTDNVLVTVEALQVKTVTFSVDSEDTAPTEMQAEENTDIILPAFTTNLTCVKFVGWTDADNDAAITSSNIYKAGDTYTVTQDITLKAVYAAGGGFVLVTDADDLAAGDHIVIAAAGFEVAMGEQSSNNRAKVDVEKDDTDNTITTPDGIQFLTLEEGTITDTYAFYTGSGYLYAASSGSNYLKTQTTNDANGSWTIEISAEGVATIKAQGSNTRNWLRYNSGSSIFSCYASGQADVSIYKESVTGYTTDPECEEYDITLEVIGHANGSAKINGQTATPTTSQTVTILNTKMATISDVANVAGYDVTVSKRSGNATFTDNGDGTWAVSEPASNVTIQVQYTAKQIYKVQFVTGTGGTGSFTSLDAYKGQTVTIPANYEAFGLCGEFVGWTEGARASGEKPTKLYQPGDPFTLNSNGTSLYAVYSISASCTSEFALGKSGDYEMYAIYSSKVYYVTQKNGTNDYFYANTEADIEANARVKSTFRMQYDATQTAAWNEQDVYAYTIYISNGSTEYGFWHLNSEGNLDFDATEPYYWKVKSYNGGYDIYGEASGKTYRITCNGSNFNARTSADAVYFTPGGGIEYWTDIDCSDINVDVTFAWNQFESWPVGMPNANSYKGLAKCSEITEFPVALQEGWTFLGWSTKEYNALHADDLDDENNASRAYPDGSDIYKTGGNTLTLGSADITLYPVFTRYEENEPLNLVNGGEFYMYVKPGNTDVYGGVRRFYIADVNLSSGGFQSTEDCNYARPFTFIKEDEGWLIQFVDEGGKTYYLGANAAASDLTKHQTSKTYWDITVGAGNNPANAYRMMAIGQGSEHALLASLSNGLTSATFKYYAIENLINTPSVYFDIFLGSCEDRVFSSDPTSKPSVTITGGGYVTGSKGQTVFVPSAFTITGKNLNDNYNVNIADVGGLLKFYNEAGNVISDFGKPLGGKLAQTTFYVAYTPTADTDGTEIPSIIVTNGTGGSALNQEITGLIHARHLPAEFAIVAKIGGNWYALPDTALHVQTPEGLLVEVDNVDSPTAVTQSFCNATAWSLRGVKNTRYVVNSVLNGDNVLFAETNTEVIDNRKMLYAGEDSKVGAYATYTNYTATNPDRYEWQLTTTDNITYTVNSNSTIVSDPLSVNNSRAFGTHGKFVASEEIRLLPIEGPCIAPAVFQVIEWKTNGMIIMYTGAGVSATTQVGTYAASDAQMTEVDHGVYELTTSQDLTACTGLKLAITFTDASSNKTQKVLVIPAIVSGEKGSTSLVASNAVAKVTDVVVLDDAKLTADGTQYTYNDVVVYPGGKLVIDDGKALGMYSLTLRAGSSWGAEKYENKYPQFLLKGVYSNFSGQINLDYVTTQDYYYPLSVPEEVTIGDIKYPVDIYGSNVDKDNTGSFKLKYYNGAQRVAQGSQYGTGWVVVDETKTLTLTPNQGYAIWGIPKKINGTRQTYGIHRIPIKKAAADLITNETNDENIDITAHGDASTPPNDRGWNYLGNPYLAQLGGMDGEDEDLQIGLLEQEKDANGDWTGGWVYNNEQVRYITVTNDCQNFDPRPVAEAQIPAFTTFFIQAAQDGAILLTAPAKPEPASIAARHYAAQQETAKEITTGILLTGNDQTDRTGLLIADNFTEEYDFNADLSKFENSGINLYTIGKDGKLAFMAINQALAEQPIPLGYSAPADGEYTIAFDEDRYNTTDISALYLIDYDRNEKTNLLHTDYSFVTTAGTNNERFALQVAFAPENATNVEWVGDATIQVGVEGNELILHNLPTDAGVQVFDALGRLMYHTPHAPTEMQITLPTGYYLVRIADKQHAVVINTIIP